MSKSKPSLNKNKINRDISNYGIATAEEKNLEVFNGRAYSITQKSTPVFSSIKNYRYEKNKPALKNIILARQLVVNDSRESSTSIGINRNSRDKNLLHPAA